MKFQETIADLQNQINAVAAELQAHKSYTNAQAMLLESETQFIAGFQTMLESQGRMVEQMNKSMEGATTLIAAQGSTIAWLTNVLAVIATRINLDNLPPMPEH